MEHNRNVLGRQQCKGTAAEVTETKHVGVCTEMHLNEAEDSSVL